MSNLAANKAQLHDADTQLPAKSSAKPTLKVGSVSLPKLDLSLVAHGDRVRLHPNSVRMLLSDEVGPQEKEFMIKGAGSWNHVLQPLLTRHVSEALVHEVTKICATVNLIPGQFLLRQGLYAKSIFIVVSGSFRLISLGAPGVEPLESSRATSARRSFTARQEAQTFGSLIDHPKSSRPSPSFASEVPVFRVATIGPGQLIGEECFSTQRIIQFSVMSESYATVLSIPVDSLSPMLSHERYAALSALCLDVLAHRTRRGAAGGSWYQSRRMELQGFKHADQPIETVGTAIQNAIKTIDSDQHLRTAEDTSHVNFIAPAYPLTTSADGQKFIQEQLMVCVVSASANSVSHLPVSTGKNTGSVGGVQVSDVASHAVAFESLASRGHTASNISTCGTAQDPKSSSRPWACNRRPVARCSNNLEIGQFVLPSQSQTGHSADMLLSRNLIIKKMYEQLQEAERSKQIRLQPKQGDQLSLKNAMNMLGRQANGIAKKSLPSQTPAESSVVPQKVSIVHTHLQKLFANAQPPPVLEPSSDALFFSGTHSVTLHPSQSRESAQSRPYNSNFSYLFEAKEPCSHHDVITKGTESRDILLDLRDRGMQNPSLLSIDSLSSKSTLNMSKVQTPHPPVLQASEQSSASVTAKRKKFAIIATANFTPPKDADLTVRSLSSRLPLHKASGSNRMFFEKHAGGSPKKFQPSSVVLSDAETKLKDTSSSDHVQPPDFFVGRKVAKESLQLSSAAIKSSVRHSVALHGDQVGPSLDRDLEHDENLNFSMCSPWKSA